MRWIIAGGGTGGHVTPALALAERIAARDDEVLLVGGEIGLETALVPAAGFAFAALPARQFMGRGLAMRLLALPPMVRAFARADKTLRAYRPDVVVSVGGYASVPTALAAFVRRVPLALVEPNAVPGRANRLAARFAARIFVQFDEAGEALAQLASADRVSVAGIPLRAALVEAFATQPPRRRPEPPLRLLVFGGSQGARQINEAMIRAAESLDPAALEIFHQTGEADRDRVTAAYERHGLSAEVVAFESDMPRRYRWADLALCRSGAITVAELALAGLPALLVPYPHAADDHQAANARALAGAGAARVFDPRAFGAGDIESALHELAAAPERLRAMAASAAKLARPDAAERIVTECAALAAEES